MPQRFREYNENGVAGSPTAPQESDMAVAVPAAPSATPDALPRAEQHLDRELIEPLVVQAARREHLAVEIGREQLVAMLARVRSDRAGAGCPARCASATIA